MTIMASTKNRFWHSPFILGLFGLLILILITGISLYNSNVDLKHRIAVAEKSTERLRVDNADLKNQLYRLLDASHLSAVAADSGLVIESYPRYLTAFPKQTASIGL